MTIEAAALSQAPPVVDVKSRVAEFLLVGGATLLLYPVSWLARRGVGLDAAEYAIGFLAFHAASVINDPHFAVTYLLFYRGAHERYRDPALSWQQRTRYVVAGFVVPLVLLAWAFTAFATRSPASLGWMIQLMFLLVGWHYVKQGFGVLTVLSARRGIRLDDTERRALLFHCFSGWAFAWSNPSAPSFETEEKGIVYVTVAHPRWVELATGSVFAVSTLLLVAVLVRRARRGLPMLPIGPLVGLLVSVWSWTILSGIDPLMLYVIPGLHSVQYLYFVYLLRRNEARASEGPPSFGRSASVKLGVLALSAVALGWLLFRGAPSFLDGNFVSPADRADPMGLGPTPYFAALSAIVNIHHYFMDHVIWRRDNPETRYLFA